MGGLFGGGGGTNTSETPATGVQFQSSANGLPVPIIFGKTRVSPNLGWYGDFNAIPHTSKQSSGGKGGGDAPTNTTFTYQASFILFLGEGPVASVPRCWKDKDAPIPATNLFSVFLGGYTQNPWSYLAGAHPDQALSYRGMAYAAANGYDLKSSASLSNHNFEVVGFSSLNPGAGVWDCDPKDILTGIFTNSHWGVPGFNASLLADYTEFSTYCKASGLLFSPAYTDQAAAAQMVTDLMQLTNSGIYFSEGLLKIVPYGDATVAGNGVTFTPSLTPAGYLGDDDFLVSSDEDPITVKRNAIPTTVGTSSDAYNQVQIEFVNRANDYQVEIAPAQDQASIDTYGLRPMSVITAHQIADAGVAQAVAQLILQRSVYIRNQYEFKLGWQWIALEPTDIVAVSDSVLGLVNFPVRIISIEEDDDGELSLVAEDAPPGAASFVSAPIPISGGYSADYNVAPGDVSAPVLFEPPVGLTGGNLQVWIAASGGAMWGGCDVWVSDDGDSYLKAGRINGPSRYGSLTASLPQVADPDLTNTLAIDLTASKGELLSSTQAQADALVTLCWVDGELLAYQTATLTSAHQYGLSYLRRGQYGTPDTTHGSGKPFVRIDDGLGKFAFTSDRINQPAYVKFVSFNVYGGGIQSLADVQPYVYTISGAALKAALANVQNLVNTFKAGLTVLAWDAVSDPVRTVDYEIRKGEAWATAQILGRTPNTEFNADGDGTYWVSAHSDMAYSAAPASLVIAGASLTKNVVAAYDEPATLWSGAITGGAIASGGSILLSGAGLFSSILLVSAEPTISYYGGVAASGSYTIPASHEVDVGTVQACNCSVSYVSRADNPYQLFSAIPQVSKAASIAGNFAGLADVKVQIATSDAIGAYGAWRDFIPGAYYGRKFKFRANLNSYDQNVIAALDGFTFTVDMPDRVDKGTSIAIPAGGLSVAYDTPFQVPPNVQATILSASQNDDVLLTAESRFGFTVQIISGGVGVARTINWLAQGY